MFSFRMTFLLLILLVNSTIAASLTAITAVTSSSLEIHCISDFPPSWNWLGVGGSMKTVSQNGLKPHPNFQDARFVFSSKNDRYSLKIDNIQIKDAGTFVCDGSTTTKYVLAIVRLVNQRLYCKQRAFVFFFVWSRSGIYVHRDTTFPRLKVARFPTD